MTNNDIDIIPGGTPHQPDWSDADLSEIMGDDSDDDDD